MVRHLVARIGVKRQARAPSPDDVAADPSGTSRRMLMTRGLSLIAGAVGLGVAGNLLQSERRPMPVSVSPAVPLALSAAMSVRVQDIRFGSAALRSGDGSTLAWPSSPHGELVNGDGLPVGTFSGGVLPGSGGAIAFQQFVFPDGTLIGMGSGNLDAEEYAVVGGTGRFAGAVGTYRTTLEFGDRGQDATFTFNVTPAR